MSFLVMCPEKTRRLLYLFFATNSAWFYAWQHLDALWEELRDILRLEMADSSGAV